ncbi:MAG TPA: hypothetical protein VMF89_03170 [Polyangiales bacterium]|nr:hypothetical protein [Polyangiales bacterium]
MLGMKPFEPALAALLFLLPVAACEPIAPAEQPAPTQPPGTPDAAIGAATTNDPSGDAGGDASALTPAAPDAANPEAAVPDTSSADATAGDASLRVDAQAPDASVGCTCPPGGPCENHTKIVGRPLCGSPVPPIPPMPPAICESTTVAVRGYCGSYACKQTPSSFSSAFNSSGNCANTRDFMCAGTIQAITYQCMINNALVVKFAEATTLCVKSDPSVTANHVGDACVGCFVTAYECCKNSEQCIAACVRGPGKACDDAQRAAGCLAPLVACSGLPNPL